MLSCVLVTALSAPTYPKEVPSSPGISYDKPAPAHSKGMPYNYNWAVADNDAGQDDQDVSLHDLIGLAKKMILPLTSF